MMERKRRLDYFLSTKKGKGEKKNREKIVILSLFFFNQTIKGIQKVGLKRRLGTHYFQTARNFQFLPNRHIHWR